MFLIHGIIVFLVLGYFLNGSIFSDPLLSDDLDTDDDQLIEETEQLQHEYNSINTLPPYVHPKAEENFTFTQIENPDLSRQKIELANTFYKTFKNKQMSLENT